MEKPKQTKVTYNNSPSQRYDVVENALFQIAEAMEWLMGYGEYEDAFNMLDDLYDELHSEYEELEIHAAAEYHEEMRRLREDYYRSVL